MTHDLARFSLATVLAVALAAPMAATARPAPTDLGATTMIGEAAPILLARHGADDPKGDDRGGRKGGKGRGGRDDGPNHAESLGTAPTLILARHGADDPAGDDRGGKRRGGKGRGGRDDGPNHS